MRLFWFGLWSAFIVLGWVLIWLSKRALPKGIPMTAGPLLWPRVTTGIYRYLRHPMYLGNTLLVTGVGGLGGGAVVALAFLLFCLTVFGEWAAREEE